MFLCVQDHPARRLHDKDDLKTAIDKLKAEHPTTLCTVGHQAAVYDTDEAGDEQLADNDFE